jgi:peptide/nickel transport system substrate-binding protein
LIDHVPPDQVDSLAATEHIKVGVYTKPLVHVIALDGRNPALRSRSLRRGISYAIDRKGLLEDHVLKHPAAGADAVADGPMPRGNYADAPGVKPLESHMWLAKMLVAAARKELHNAPIKLNFEYPAIPEVQAVIEKLAASIREAGVEIVTAEVRPSQLESELRAGRRFELAYRILRCDEPVLDAGALICPGYDAPPEADALASIASPRVLQLLLQLERAAEWPTARGLALQIDRESRDELPVIPLWQLVDHYAWRDRLRGPGKAAAELYQGIESWDIAPWIAKDAWDVH